MVDVDKYICIYTIHGCYGIEVGIIVFNTFFKVQSKVDMWSVLFADYT